MAVRTENKGNDAARHRGAAGHYRIIGGRWRRRRIAIAGGPGLRPTPDRVRETLFNWLARVVNGIDCLDLFAGSGALGLEALSRGAASVVMIEKQRAAASHLRGQMALIGAEAVLHQDDALAYLGRPGSPYGLVFVDPPYDGGLIAPVVKKLETGGWLGEQAYIYVEHGARETLPVMPPNWQHWRDGKAGQVRYHLFDRRLVEDNGTEEN